MKTEDQNLREFDEDMRLVNDFYTN